MELRFPGVRRPTGGNVPQLPRGGGREDGHRDVSEIHWSGVQSGGAVGGICWRREIISVKSCRRRGWRPRETWGPAVRKSDMRKCKGGFVAAMVFGAGVLAGGLAGRTAVSAAVLREDLLVTFDFN